VSIRTITPRDIVQVIVRKRWLVLVPFALGVAMAPILARYAPERYRSEALLLVIPQQVPKDYVTPTMTQPMEDRLPAITDQILSRSRLEQIIQQFDLYPEDRARQVMEDVVQRMRRDVATTPVQKDVDVNSFRVAYVSDSAEKARKVTERLASLYIEQNLKDRENQADSTSQFLTTQLETAKQRLIEQEKKLEGYRKTHAGQLPSQMQGNLQAIQTASLQLQSLNESMNRAQERRLLIERQMADSQVIAVPAPVTSQDAAPVGTAQQLQLARARLAAALQRYTPNHPEVTSLERTIADLVVKLENETPVGVVAAEARPPVSPAEAAQQKRTSDLKAELAVLDFQLTANRTEAARLNQQIAEYQSKIDVLPTRESELVELTRDYATMQAAYTNLLVKREDAMLAANLERRQIGEQFKLLDTASLPERPFNQQQRVAIMSAGAIAGLILGLLLIGLGEFHDSSFRTEEEALRALSVPVLALIPSMSSAREAQAVKRRARLMDAFGGAILTAAALVLVVWRLQS
jgi:polysaccharide chain length determinant protein (PEP-CTERM system associated)